MQARSNSASGTVPYTVQLYLRTGLDNFVGSSTPLTVSTASTSQSANESISLASLGTLAAAGQPITFRLYPVDNQQAAGNDDFKFDNLVVNGSVSVPELGTYALLGFGILGALLLRRRTAC